jgi:hypothetical protein
MVTRRKAAPVEEAFEEVDDDLEELEEPEDDLEELEDEEEEEEEPAPKKRGRPAKKAAPVAKKVAKKTAAAEDDGAPEYGSVWLAEYVSEQTGKEYDSRSMRVLLRRLAKDGTLPREIGVDRSRYEFPKGENDPTVKQIVRLVKSGAVEKARAESLASVKETAAKKKAAPAAAPVKKATKKAAPAKKARAKA